MLKFQKKSNKITNLDKLCTIAHLIHDFPCKDNNGVRIKKDKLYVAVLIVLKSFILEKKRDLFMGYLTGNCIPKYMQGNATKIFKTVI